MSGFTLSAQVYREIATAMKAFIAKDPIRPLLTAIHIEQDESRLRFSAADSYAAIVADTVPHESDGDLDVCVPGALFCSLKPSKRESAVFAQDDDGICAVTAGVMTIRLDPIERVSEAYSYPDLDSIAGKEYASETKTTIPHGVLLNPWVISRIAVLPKQPVNFRFRSPMDPIFFGVDSGFVRFQGCLMGVRPNDGQLPMVWQPWAKASEAVKEAA